VNKDEILAALNHYYSREMAMREHRKEKQQEAEAAQKSVDEKKD
jgi:hypothetical protein